MSPTQERRVTAPALLIAVLTALVCAAWAAPALGAGPPGYARDEPVCPAPGLGEATCFAFARVPVPASEAGRPGVRRLAVRPAAVELGPGGGLTPALLASVYGYDPSGGAGKTVAVVDAFDDPKAESDLAEFSRHYGLPECTSANKCFKKVGQTGSPAALPAADSEGWSVEVALDVETVHAACQQCHILLVEAKNAQMTNLGAAVEEAAEMGAQVVSNSYGAPEQGAGPTAAERALFEHPGVVITAATGDFGYDWWSGPLPDPASPDVPASLPGVVSVGGTSLVLSGDGKRAAETVWNGKGRLNSGAAEAGVSGGGCSAYLQAPFWQRYASGFFATGCGDKRLSADVSAVADPQLGMDVFDTYDCGPDCEKLTRGEEWSTIGGTSLSAPLIGSLYALAGGADGISYPALTLYAHLGEAALFDVTGGGNGYCNDEGRPCGVNAGSGRQLDCEGTTACNAAPGYDGPSGVGTPTSLEAFEPLPEEEEKARRRAEEGVIEEARRVAEEIARKVAAEEAARLAAEAAAHKAASGQGTAGFKASVIRAATLRGTRLQAGRGGLVTVKVGCPAGASACAGTVTVRTLGAVIAGPGAHASVLTLATGRFKVSAGHVTAVRLRLTRRGAALLARRGKLRVRVLIATHGAARSSHAAATLNAFKHR